MSRLPKRISFSLATVLLILLGFAPQAHADLARFTATAGDGEVTVNWSWSGSDSAVANWQYQVKEGSGSFSGWQSYSGSFSKSKRSHTFTGLTNGTAYTYRMRGQEGFIFSDILTTNSVTPTPDNISQVAVTSTPQSDHATGSWNVYGAGEKIQITVTFTKAATVTGDPELEIKLGSPGPSVAKRALYVSGTGTTQLVFEYTVLPTDEDNNGIWIEANALKLDADDAIQDGDSNPLTLRHDAPGSQRSHRVDGSRTPPVPNAAPTASNGTVTMKEDATYTFRSSDFNFMDADVDDELDSVIIQALPGAGTLLADGKEISALDKVYKEDIDDGSFLTFEPASGESGSPYTTFTFKVNDGDDDSADTYTMTINVQPPPCLVETPAHAIWSACLTIGKNSGSSPTTGYSVAHGGGGSLSDTTIDHDGNEYDIVALGAVSGQFSFQYEADPGIRNKNMVLRVGSTDLAFTASDATTGTRSHSFTLPASLAWTDANIGDRVTVSLREVRPPNDRVNVYFISDVPYWGTSSGPSGDNCVRDPGSYEIPPSSIPSEDDPYNRRCFVPVTEQGSPQTFRVRMKEPLTESITASVRSSDSNAASVSPGSLTFTPDNWHTNQVITVTGEDDADGLDEWPQVFIGGKGTISSDFVLIRVRDNDEHEQTGSSLIVTDAPGFRVKVVQGGTSSTFTVRPRYQPPQTVTVVWDSLENDMPVRPGNSENTSIKIITDKDNNRGVTIQPREMKFTPGNWTTAQTFTVTADSDTQGAEIALRPWWHRKSYPYTATPEIRILVLSNQSTTVPGAPQGSVAPGNGRLRVTWVPAEDSESITSWQYRYGEHASEEVSWNAWKTVPGGQPDAASHTIDGLTNGTRYGVQVRGVVGNLRTPATNTLTATPQAGLTLDAPARPRLDTRSGNGQVDLSWEVPDFGGTITGWQYRYRQMHVGVHVDWGDWTAIAGATATTDAYTVTGLVNDTRYGFQLRAVAGEHFGDMSTVETGWPWHPTFAMAQVTNAGADSVTVSWELPQDVVGTGLRAEHRVPEGEWQSTDLALDATTHEFTGLEHDTVYNFRIFLDSDTGGTSTGTLVQRTAEDSGWGVLTGFTLVDASDDTDLDTLANNATVQVSADGVYGMRANVDPDGGVQSVVLTLEKGTGSTLATQTENIAPYSLYGDADGAEHGRALPADTYQLHAVAYASKDGNGEVLGSRTVNFTVESTGEAAAPAVASFSLVDASNQAVLATLTGDSNTVYLADPGGGSYALRANLKTEITAGSVVLSLSGAKTASRTESMAPYSLWGDSPGTGGDRNLDGSSLPAGNYTLSASVFSKSRGEGTQLGTAATVSFTVHQRVQLSVGSAHATEGENDHLPFNVHLDRESTGTVTVNYTTVDGTATAGADYTAASGTLTFAPGDIRKQVRVAVLEDDHDEEAETVIFRISNPSGAVISGAEGTGTISNSDALPRAWLSRFGRTVATQVVDAVQDRLSGSTREPVEVKIAGHSIKEYGASEEDIQALLNDHENPDKVEKGRGVASLGRLMLDSSFSLSSETKAAEQVSVWGRGAVSSFDGREGTVSLDGEVETLMLGTDWTHGDWMRGVMVSHSMGDGDYQGEGGGRIESELSGLWPYGQYRYSERLTLWGVAGYGDGTFELKPEGQETIETGMDLLMGAVGLRGLALEASGGTGLELAVTSDAMMVHTESDRTTGLAPAEADVSRVRLGLEGIWQGLGGWEPSFELGMRHDDGDAETGFGADIGAGLVFTDKESGISAEIHARTLVAHEASGFEEYGISGTLNWDPNPASTHGPAFTLTQTRGASASGGMDALLSRETLAGLSTGDADRPNRLEGEFGFGVAAFDGRFTGVPNIGFGLLDSDVQHLRMGWKLVSTDGFAGSMDMIRREDESELTVTATVNW